MNRVNLQVELANTIEQAKIAVKSRKGARAAVRTGVYKVGNRVFVSLDGENLSEVRGEQVFDVPASEVSKYMQPGYELVMSYEFKDVPVESLKRLIEMFKEVAAI
jgi:hypothetical protein